MTLRVLPSDQVRGREYSPSAGYAASRSMTCLTLRRSMLRSRAIDRWLLPSACQVRIVCSNVGTVCTTSGSALPVGGAESFGVASSKPIEVARWWLLISTIRSSRLPTRAKAGQALAKSGHGLDRGPGWRRPWPRRRRLGSIGHAWYGMVRAAGV